MEFHCIQDCSQCCIEREYYPNKKFGKIGVLILPEEKERIEKLADDNRIKVKIIPRIGISDSVDDEPKIIAYQMMGNEENGNTCHFLDTKSGSKSPHGGYPCKIYSDRPLACMAYPLLEDQPIQLDEKCKFCKEKGNASENLHAEIESLLKIKSKMNVNSKFVWRYATGIGEVEDKDQIQKGWILEQ